MQSDIPNYTLENNQYFRGVVRMPSSFESYSLQEKRVFEEHVGEERTFLYLNSAQEIAKLVHDTEINSASGLLRFLKKHSSVSVQRIDQAIRSKVKEFLTKSQVPNEKKLIGSQLICKSPFNIYFNPISSEERTFQFGVGTYEDRDPDAGVPMQDAPDKSFDVNGDAKGTLYTFNLDFHLTLNIGPHHKHFEYSMPSYNEILEGNDKQDRP